MSNKKKPAKKAIKKKPVAKKKAARKIINMIDVSSTDPKDYLRVTAINPKSDDMVEAFGITKERFQELDIAALSAMRTTDKFSSAVEKVSESCKHANELAMCVFLLSEERNRIPSFLQALISARGKPNKD